VSRIERQRDLYLSTVAEYVEALGGHTEISAVFDDGEELEIRAGVELAGSPIKPTTGGFLYLPLPTEDRASRVASLPRHAARLE
jgi:hypothetical protein